MSELRVHHLSFLLHDVHGYSSHSEGISYQVDVWFVEFDVILGPVGPHFPHLIDFLLNYQIQARNAKKTK